VWYAWKWPRVKKTSGTSDGLDAWLAENQLVVSSKGLPSVHHNATLLAPPFVHLLQTLSCLPQMPIASD
jgi:hypothetical protein